MKSLKKVPGGPQRLSPNGGQNKRPGPGEKGLISGFSLAVVQAPGDRELSGPVGNCFPPRGARECRGGGALGGCPGLLSGISEAGFFGPFQKGASVRSPKWGPEGETPDGTLWGKKPRVWLGVNGFPREKPPFPGRGKFNRFGAFNWSLQTGLGENFPGLEKKGM